ncbi:2-oxoglutarate dehydrogenase E1 component, partial [bacterium]|nr:2-oxoglutarate dehydrogenase E1 component [bacterium]
SLDGCESLIPLLDLAIDHAGTQGCKEIVLAMAHRGRLNVLANVMGKQPKQIFREFADKDPGNFTGRGDVKYHLGQSCDYEISDGSKVHLSLCFNPSHLEFVNTVALGRTRAKQDRVHDFDHETCMCLLIHGDAAFIGEGVSQETLNLSQLPGYTVGGTLHVVVNNQIGFTTAPDEGRSSAYATDIAKMLQIPIFHVNGEDPEAVAQVVRLALDFRKSFKRDVVIDMYGYRRLGHNETDEASFTQPLMCREIEKRESVLQGYLHHLHKLDEVTPEEAEQIQHMSRAVLEKHLNQSKRKNYRAPKEKFRGIWSRSTYVGGSDVKEVVTGVSTKKLAAIIDGQTRHPRDFTPHPKIKKLLEIRRAMAQGERPLDWAVAESCAFGSLALEGYRIRLSGQDVRRGTFSHRHAALFDYQDGLPYLPLQHLSPGKQKPVEIYNSPLSETGVLGFDYGYSLDCPDGIVLWEAQFGDFVNAAQVIVDQFITSAEDKWNRLSGLVMLLPHGFEGMGPEHSSARLERFLVLSAENNIQVMNLTTPAQYFHALRRQALRRWRKPLIIMSPKSLLRHPKVVSDLESLDKGEFQRLIPDNDIENPAKVKRALICSGKIYYDLLQYREETGQEQDIAILRLEQLYPLSPEEIGKAFSVFKTSTPAYWVQEEPENMGAWRYMRAEYGDKLPSGNPFNGIARAESASPATGSANSHRREQRQILRSAMDLDFEPTIGKLIQIEED